MNLLAWLGVAVVVFWIYIFWLREFLDAHLQGTAYAWWHEKVEDVFWDRSRTILGSRLYWLGGVIVVIHDLAASAGLDWTPITTELGNLIPEQYRGLAIGGVMIMTGLLFEWLRRKTTTPLVSTDQQDARHA